MYYLLLTVYILSCIVLIMFVLLQPGKSDAAAVFGGGANSAAFGPRGTQTVLAKITIVAAVLFFLTAFLFSIPGLFERQSAGESIPAESAPSAPINTPTETPPAPAEPGNQPAASPDAGASKPAANDSNKGGQKKDSSTQSKDKKPEPKKDSK